MQDSHPKHIYKFSYRYNISQDSELHWFTKGQTEEAYLLKYFPKYYHKISLTKIDPPTALKVKGLKRVHHFQGNFNSTQANYFSSVLLQKIRKDLRTTAKIHTDGDLAPDERRRWYGKGFKEIRRFSGITKIEIPAYFVDNPFGDNRKNSKAEVNRILAYLSHAQNLKRIDLAINQKMSEVIAKKLRSCQKLAGKVEDSSASIHCFQSSNIVDLASENNELIQKISRLDISGFKVEDLEELAKVLNVFKGGLESLKVQTDLFANSCNIEDGDLEKMYLKFYKALGELSNLKELWIRSPENTLAWMKDFCLPKSLKTLQITLFSYNSMLTKVASQGQGFQDVRIFKNFFSSIWGLSFLECLELKFNFLFYDDSHDVLDFAICLLKAVPIGLSTLRLHVPSFKVERSTSNLRFDFSRIFERIQHLKGLRELTIEFPEFLRPVIFNPSFMKCLRFPKLSILNIEGNIDPQVDVEKTLMMLTDSLEVQCELKIGTINVDSEISLQLLLENMRNAGRIETNIQLEIEINIQYIDPEEIVKILVAFIKDMGCLKGLKMKITLNPTETLEDLLETIKKYSKMDRLKVIVFDFLTRRQEACYLFKKGILAMKK